MTSLNVMLSTFSGLRCLCKVLLGTIRFDYYVPVGKGGGVQVSKRLDFEGSILKMHKT